jgi:beta-glucanase (GH16 family)
MKISAQIKWQMNKDTIISWFYTDGDEFNTKTLNTHKWKYWYGWSRSIFFHKEQEYYSDGQNHELKDGCLNLFAKRERVEKRIVDWLDDTTSIYNGKINTGPNKRIFNYSSGMIQSVTKFKYGYFEIKFKIPKEKGYWPAFWLQGGFPNEEIDWMELKTEKKNANHVGRHSQKPEENKLRNYIRKKSWGDWVYFKGNLSDEWNIVSGEWTPEYLKYYLNGECIAYSKISLNIEKNLCTNLAVPGNKGAFKPGPDTNIIKSSDFKIDYIRVWSSNPKTESVNNITFENSGNTKIGQTKLKSKTRFLYGNKKNHLNEGITVTLLPLKNNQFELQVLGKEIPATSYYCILDSNKKIIYTENLKYDSSIIDINSFTGNDFELKINYLTQNVLYKLEKIKN